MEEVEMGDLVDNNGCHPNIVVQEVRREPAIDVHGNQVFSSFKARGDEWSSA